MLRIGNVELGLKGPAYDSFVHKAGMEWATQPRWGRAPAKQLTGVSDETITISGDIYTLFNNLGIGQVQKLEAAMLEGSPQLVIDGTGRKYGYFVIDEVEDSRMKFIDTGAPQKQSFSLKMSRYGEDTQESGLSEGNGSLDLGGRNGNIA